VLIIASLVDAVATEHKDNRPGRSEHVLSTDWAVAVRYSLYAFMGMLYRHRHANAASLAVEEIFSEPTTFSAYTTIIAMVDVFVGIIVP